MKLSKITELTLSEMERLIGGNASKCSCKCDTCKCQCTDTKPSSSTSKTITNNVTNNKSGLISECKL